MEENRGNKKSMTNPQRYYVYMVRCEDQSIYTGITTDLRRRLKEHLDQLPPCAKYTLHHQVVKLECAWKTETRSLASKLEFRIKKLTKQQKESLIAKRGSFSELLGKYLNKKDFQRLTKKESRKIEKDTCTFPKNAIKWKSEKIGDVPKWL